MKGKIKIMAFAFVFLVSASFVAAQSFGYGGKTTYQIKPSFHTYYGSDIQTYWPQLAKGETCEARNDIMLNVAPAGCQPTVVRSDLLAEQDVPVFCQIDSFEINPLIDIKQIKHMQFGGEYPPEVKGAKYHPARAALRTHNKLLGSPLVNNVGYVVVILKREPVESRLPDFVNVTLHANIDYIADNAYGVGKSEFVLKTVSESDWEEEKLKNSFWEGRFFVRLEEADEEAARVSIYYGDKKVSTTNVQIRQTSNRLFLPGFYCRAGMQIAYDGFESDREKATIEVSSDGGIDRFDVFEGSRFMDDRCFIKDIEISGDTGKVVGNCKGKSFVLELKSKNDTTEEGIVIDGKEYKVVISGEDFRVDLGDLSDEDRRGKYYLDAKDDLVNNDGTIVMTSEFVYDESVKEKDKNWFKELWSKLFDFKNKKAGLKGGSKFESSSVSSIKYYDEALESYEEVVDQYSNEPNEAVEKDGEKALARAIDLAGFFGRDFDQIKLINKFLENYPSSDRVNKYLNDLSILENVDTSGSWEAIDFDDKSRVIRLVPGSLLKPSKTPSVTLIIGQNKKSINEGDKEDLASPYGDIVVERVEVDDVKVSVLCNANGKSRKSIVLEKDKTGKEICDGLIVKLDGVDLESAAKIRILPFSEHTKSQSTFTVNIGIEKRAIELNPDKALKKINDLNKTIEKWENIADGLGKVVTGMKGACFATAGVLTFKNFMSGLSGEALARQEVMNGEEGWTKRCNDMVKVGGYMTLNQCYLGEAANINADVSKVSTAIANVNGKIQNIQSGEITSSNVFGNSVNTDNVKAKMAQQIKTEFGGEKINAKWIDKDGIEHSDVSVNDLLSSENANGFTQDSLRSLWMNLELKKTGGLSSGQGENADSKLTSAAELINNNLIVDWAREDTQSFKELGLGSPLVVKTENQEDRAGDVVKLTSNVKEYLGNKFESKDITHTATLSVIGNVVNNNGEKKTFETGNYIVGLKEDGVGSGRYSPIEVLQEKNGQYEKLNNDEAFLLLDSYGVGRIIDQGSLSYVNEIADQDRIVKYYTTEPYAGMPAIVPFDVNEGWYAGTRQTLPVFGGIGAFDASGRVTSFWVCNVGENGRIEFDTGYGDDLCQQVNLNTGAPLIFPGKSESESKQLVNRAVNAINEAAVKYGNKYVTINGQQMKTDITTGVPETQCQDFMSPNDCHLLFNVCDPVICPSSRCDFGGKFRVANVAQTGIVGSTLLCLPNVREGIVVPVCLTGIHAGIEGLVSIMRNYRDCLQENVETGQLVGVCDQIYSIYLCEFIWNQIAPFVNILIPKLVEVAYGQGTRGGAEYLTVMSAWNNMQDSINYFTQSYAVNSLRAFQARSISEAGTPVCKAFISAKAPDTFKSLLEPDSPPQFHAWFDEKTFTTATVPATSQYKVFYHIFAGKDQGIHFSFCVGPPPQSSYYSTAPYVQVASDFVPRGEYASETKDFTAPEGYKELCVRINNDEHCGFKQVSSSFAVNYLRDSFVQDELQNTNIQSEEQCISGASNPGALLTPNIQSGVEEFISPEAYNRGIARICGTNNPGSATDPTRFVDVGYCGDPKIRCWLDKRSVDNAITNGNFGLKNETLSVLEQQMLSNFEKEGTLLNPDEAKAEIYSLQEALSVLRSPETKDKEKEAKKILDRIKIVQNMIYTFAESARLLLIEGQVNEEVARFLLSKEYQKIRESREPGTGIGESISTSKPAEKVEEEQEAEDEFLTAQECVENEGGIVVPKINECFNGYENIGEVIDLHYDAVCCFGEPIESEADPEIKCGDNKAEGLEECDGIDLKGETCTTWIGEESEGELECVAAGENNECKFDVSDCKSVEGEEVQEENVEEETNEEEQITEEESEETQLPVEEGVECELYDAYVQWMDDIENNENVLQGNSATVNHDDVVFLTVRGNADCDPNDLMFEIFEDDPLIDDFYETLSNNVGSYQSGGDILYYKSWTADYNCEGVEIGGVCVGSLSEYKFRVVMKGGSVGTAKSTVSLRVEPIDGGSSGEEGSGEEESNELSFEERFDLTTDSSGEVDFMYRKTQTESYVYTELFVPVNTKVMSYKEFSNVVAKLDKRLGPLKSGQSAKIIEIVIPEQDILGEFKVNGLLNGRIERQPDGSFKLKDV